MANMALLSTGTRHPIDKDYNGTIRKLGGYELFFLGAPRIRQLRVTNTSCKVADAIVGALPVGGGTWAAQLYRNGNGDRKSHRFRPPICACSPWGCIVRACRCAG